jgi:hypothetical protein
MSLIVPDEEVGSSASPDIITTNLDAYIKGVAKIREKEWDTIGSRRIGELWNGKIWEGEGKKRHLNLLGRRSGSKSATVDNYDENEGERGKKPLKDITARTGQVIKDGFGLVR